LVQADCAAPARPARTPSSGAGPRMPCSLAPCRSWTATAPTSARW